MAKAEFVSKDGSLTELLNKAYNRKPTEEQLDKFCQEAREAAEVKAPPFDPEPNMTKAQQSAAQQRAGLRSMLYGLNGLR